MNKQFNNVDYSEYEGKYDESIKERLEKDPGSVDVEMMRANLYGYTYTKEYAAGEIPDEFSMDYWEERQEEMELDNPKEIDFESMRNEIYQLLDKKDNSPYFDVIAWS